MDASVPETQPLSSRDSETWACNLLSEHVAQKQPRREHMGREQRAISRAELFQHREASRFEGFPYSLGFIHNIHAPKRFSSAGF